MAILDWFDWQNIRLQYMAIYSGLTLFKSLPFVETIISTIGGSIVLTTLAWNLTKYFRTFYNREYISSAKRAVLITGAEKGLAKDLAIKLNEHGYRVYATVMNNEEQTAQNLKDESRFENLMNVKKMDVTLEEEVNKMAKEITEELETNGEELWAVVNGAEVREFANLDWSHFQMYDKIFEVNTFGLVRVVRAFLPLIRKSKGRIINIESIAGRLTIPQMTAFCMSKHSNLSFSDALRRQLFDSGVKISTIEMAFDREANKQDETNTPSKFTRSIKEQWDKTTQTVKDIYGDLYLEQIKKEKFTEIFKNNLDGAMNDLIDAIRGQDPSVRYTPYSNCKAKLLSNLVGIVPIEWLDTYYNMSQKNSVKPSSNQISDESLNKIK